VGLVVFCLYVVVLVYGVAHVGLFSGLFFWFWLFFIGCFGVASEFFLTRTAWLHVETAFLCL
jgi:hypothetical protein